MSGARIAQVKLSRILSSIYRMLELLFQLYGHRGHSSESAKSLGLQSRYELGVAERFVIAAIAQKLGGIVEVCLQFVVGEAGLFRKRRVVAMAVLVESDYEVIDGFGFGGDLAEYDAGTCKRGTIKVLVAAIRKVHKDTFVRINPTGRDGERIASPCRSAPQSAA